VVPVVGDRTTQVCLKSKTINNGPSKVLLGIYYTLVGWDQFNYSFLIGLGRFWFASSSHFTGAAIMFADGSCLVAEFGVPGVLAPMYTGPLFVTAWVYPLKLRRLPQMHATDIMATKSARRVVE
jgi:hypothetical protein